MANCGYPHYVKLTKCVSDRYRFIIQTFTVSFFKDFFGDTSSDISLTKVEEDIEPKVCKK